MEPARHENYPFSTVLLSNLVTFAIYGIGAFVILRLGTAWLVIYLLYIVFLEVKLLRHCAGCYYHGKTCGFGRGKLSCLFIKKSESWTAGKRQVTWKDIIPDFLVSIIPFLTGIILLIKDFSWALLLLLAVLLLLASAGSGFIRGTLVCKHCKQQEFCPASNLLNKKNPEE